jgi:hypothetical protein
MKINYDNKEINSVNREINGINSEIYGVGFTESYYKGLGKESEGGKESFS